MWCSSQIEGLPWSQSQGVESCHDLEQQFDPEAARVDAVRVVKASPLLGLQCGESRRPVVCVAGLVRLAAGDRRGLFLGSGDRAVSRVELLPHFAGEWGNFGEWNLSAQGLGHVGSDLFRGGSLVDG